MFFCAVKTAVNTAIVVSPSVKLLNTKAYNLINSCLLSMIRSPQGFSLRVLSTIRIHQHQIYY